MKNNFTTTQTRWGLLLVLVIYLGLAMAISQVTPFNKGPDEETNLAYIDFIVKHGRLPIDYEERKQVGKDSNWPALYQLMVAGISRAANVTIGEQPYVKILWNSFRYRTLDTGEAEPYYLRTEDQLYPYQGRFFVWQIGRWLSIGFGVLTLLLVYKVTQEILPHQPIFALVAAAWLAFIPTFIFMSAVLNEDTLMAALTTIYLWLLILIVKQPHRVYMYGWLGFILGLSITIKYTTIVLPVEIVLVIAYLAYQHGLTVWWWLNRVTIVGLTTMLGSSWWFGWNFWYLNEIEKYGLFVGLMRPIFTGGPDVTLARLGYIFSQGEIGLSALPERRDPGTITQWLEKTWLSFWGISAGGVIPWYPWVYALIALVSLLVMVGLWQRWRQEIASRQWIALLLLHIGMFIILPILRFFLSRRIGETAQGRHILIPAVAAVLILMVWGLATVVRSINGQRVVFATIIALFLGWSVAHWHRLAIFVAPPLPMRTTAQAAEWLPQPSLVNFDDAFELVSYRIEPQPEQSRLTIELAWRPLQAVHQNYLLQLTLQNSSEAIVSHWLGYNGQGRVPTLAWQVGDTIFDRLYLPLPHLAAGDYTLHLNWLDSSMNSPFTETLIVAIQLPQATRPLAKTELNGMSYTAWDSHQAATVWEALGHQPYGYRYPGTISVLTENVSQLELIDETNQQWQPTYQTDNLYTFVIGPRWSTGNYRLALTSANGAVHETDSSISIENWWPRYFEPPEPIGQSAQANFADQIHYLGYTLPKNSVKAGEAFPLTVYWQAPPHQAPQADFTQFNNLLDHTGTLRGGYERQPLEYYSTLLWAPGEVVVDGYTIPVAVNAPPGQYYLDVGYYLTVGESAVNLPLMVDGQMTEQSSVTIGPIEVVGE